MFATSNAFSGFSVNDTAAAKKFYAETLGLQVEDMQDPSMFTIKLGSGADVFVYTKPNHTPASFTILNFPVENIDTAVDELRGRGVSFELIDGFEQDEKGILRGEPRIAWFTDPAGNVLSVLQES